MGYGDGTRTILTNFSHFLTNTLLRLPRSSGFGNGYGRYDPTAGAPGYGGPVAGGFLNPGYQPNQLYPQQAILPNLPLPQSIYNPGFQLPPQQQYQPAPGIGYVNAQPGTVEDDKQVVEEEKQVAEKEQQKALEEDEEVTEEKEEKKKYKKKKPKGE